MIPLTKGLAALVPVKLLMQLFTPVVVDYINEPAILTRSLQPIVYYAHHMNTICTVMVECHN